MIAKNAENAMVCDPVLCATRLCELLETLRFVSSAGIDSMAAAIAMLRPKLASASKLVPPPRRRREITGDQVFLGQFPSHFSSEDCRRTSGKFIIAATGEKDKITI